MSEGQLIAKLSLIASEIRHENELIGQRTTWLVIAQSFLFGTFVAVVGQRSEGARTSIGALLFVLIPFVGVLLPVLVLLAVGAASFAIWEWRAEHDRLCEGSAAKDLDWPRLGHRFLLTVFGHALPVGVSIGFLLAWIVVLIAMRRA